MAASVPGEAEKPIRGTGGKLDLHRSTEIVLALDEEQTRLELASPSVRYNVTAVIINYRPAVARIDL